MGVVNLTTDSFSDGGVNLDAPDAVRAALAHAAGAVLIDLGAESTRPGATPVSASVEKTRLLPVIDALVGRLPGAAISVDTYKAEVADVVLAAGAEVINDISGGALDPDLLGVVARHGAAVVLGHLRGTPADMRQHAQYSDVVAEVRAELQERVARAREAGIAAERILVDPGLGFAKTAAHNWALLGGLHAIVSLGYPVVVGASRKSFLGELTGRAVDDREVAGAACHAVAVLHGARVLRVHDVARQRDAALVADAARGVHGVSGVPGVPA